VRVRPAAILGDRSVTRRIGVLLALLIVSATLVSCGKTDAIRKSSDACFPTRSLAVGTSHVSMDDVSGRRTYLLHVPSGYDGTTRTPVVVLFHGLGGNSAAVAESTRMTKLSDKAGFILVVPQGLGKISRWDFRSAPSAKDSDLGFAKRLVTSIRSSACVDPHRIYAAGFSNGSALTLALACQGTTGFAAYAAVAAPYFNSTCKSAPPASIIYFHGSADKVVPFGGGNTAIGPLPGVTSTLRSWATHDACPPRGARTTVSTHVTHFAWTGCRGGTGVDVYEVLHGGHAWPGQATGSPGRVQGVQTKEVNASELIWRFFQAHHSGGQ
jgi:polyhydroxybutyrate depolymerase